MSEAWSLELALDRHAAIDTPYACWLRSDDSDSAEDYCLECAEKAAAEQPGVEIGAYGASAPRDGCMHCATCGRLLDYNLTDYGVKEELEHFREHPPTVPLDREVAAHISRIIAAAPENAEALALARAAVRAIPQPSAPPAERDRGGEMINPTYEVLGPDHPISKVANAMSGQAFTLAAQFGISRWDLCIAMANACGQILADAASPSAQPPLGVTMPRRGKGLPRDVALERMNHLRVVMASAYELRTVEGEG